MAYQVTERLYVDKNDKVYREDELTERSEVTLLMTAGGELTDADAKKYGLTAPKAKASAPVADEAGDGDEADADADEADAKAVASAPADKAVSAKASK